MVNQHRCSTNINNPTHREDTVTFYVYFDICTRKPVFYWFLLFIFDGRNNIFQPRKLRFFRRWMSFQADVYSSHVVQFFKRALFISHGKDGMQQLCHTKNLRDPSLLFQLLAFIHGMFFSLWVETFCTFCDFPLLKWRSTEVKKEASQT